MHEKGLVECVAKVDGVECQYICEDGAGECVAKVDGVECQYI